MRILDLNGQHELENRRPFFLRERFGVPEVDGGEQPVFVGITIEHDVAGVQIAMIKTRAEHRLFKPLAGQVVELLRHARAHHHGVEPQLDFGVCAQLDVL